MSEINEKAQTKEAVALEMALRFNHLDRNEQIKFLKFYKECWSAVNGGKTPEA